MNKKILLFCHCIMLSFGIAQAQNQLNEVTITANKFEQKLSETGKVLVVLTDSVIRQSASLSLGELLNRQAGIMVVGSNNGFGFNQDIRLRGATGGNTLILLDGVPVYDPSNINNAFDLNAISLAQVERIEILKGSQSTLYGSDATAGVVNIISKKATKAKSNSYGSVNYGSYNTLNTQVGIGGGIGKLNYQLQVGRLKSKGFSFAAANPASSSIIDLEKDAYLQNSLQVQLSSQLSKQLFWKIQVQNTKQETDLDAAAYKDDHDFVAKNDNRQVSVGAEYELKKGKINFNYLWNTVSRVYTDDSTFVPAGAYSKYSVANYASAAHFVELYTKNNFNQYFDWLIGADLRLQNTDQGFFSISQYGAYTEPPLAKDIAQINAQSVFASVFLKNYHHLFVELGGRFNNHSVYGTNFTYSLNPSYRLNENLKLFANVSSGFKAPTLYQLFSPYGNANLTPESTQSFEIGANWTSKKINSRFTYFKRNTDNVIMFQSLSVEPYGRYQNALRQIASGVELENRLTLNSKININFNYTFVDGEVQQQGTMILKLMRVPKNSGNVGFNYMPTSKILLSFNSRYMGKRTDLFFNENTFQSVEKPLPAYALLDTYGEYRLGAATQIFVAINNLSNQTYEDIIGYQTQKRNFRVGLMWRY